MTRQAPANAPSLTGKTLPVSVILTVRNEEESLPSLFSSLLAQSAQPAEVVVADGGSTDGTVGLVRSYLGRLPLRLVEVPGANISEGRNAAIRAAGNEIIASTDAGVRLDPRWLETLVGPLLQGHADVAAGFFVADPRTPFELAMGATVLPGVEDIQAETFLPSSRSVAFLKSAWERIGGYPEWLDYCEDLVFDLALKEAGYRFAFVPEAVAHFRPRSSLRAFVLQYYRYARGDGKAELWRKRHAIRYLTYAAGPALGLWGWRYRGTTTGKAALLSVALCAGLYCRKPYIRLLPLRDLDIPSALYALALVPLIRLTGDIAKMAGYPVGVYWRLRNRG